ncbi:MAG: matrixin family metalloprotease [Chloroflexota bacterium]
MGSARQPGARTVAAVVFAIVLGAVAVGDAAFAAPTTRMEAETMIPLAVENVAWPRMNLSYGIIRRGGAPVSSVADVQKGIDSWNAALRGSTFERIRDLQLVPATPGETPQIEIAITGVTEGAEAGYTVLYFDELGALQYAAITIRGRGMAPAFNSRGMTATAIHELGHALGLEHSTNRMDPMYFHSFTATAPSPCDIQAVASAHEWYVSGHPSFYRPNLRRVVCPAAS